MKQMLSLGIDTSNYTTSVALARGGRIIANLKAPLPVKEGECGLRQSDALFAHIKNLPTLAESLREALAGEKPTVVGVSCRPRHVDGSYMPCFLGGVAAAETVAASLGVPLYRFSHQCGHLRAAMYAAEWDALRYTEFGAFHISGGTTEMLYVKGHADGFTAEIIGGTRDLNAGQLIDRIGVMLGLSFPCGPALERLAMTNTQPVPHRRVKTEAGYIHLSGLENISRKLYEESKDAALVAAFVLQYLADAVVAMSRDLRAMRGEDTPILYAGGVMSNSLIREAVTAKLRNVRFATPAFSADNAAGIALLAEEAACRTDE